jgi:teichuronic acid biosynthesis glycosyltransferase TuaG
MKSLVSVVTPVYNSADFLRRTFISLLDQTYTNWEWILVDDCSTDNSIDIINEIIRQDSRVKLLCNSENAGSGVARNKAIEASKGKFIAFLDSDDIWHKDKLAIQVEFMEKNAIPFSHTSYGYIDEFDRKIKSTFHVSKHPVSYFDLLKRTEISCLTAMYNCEELGRFYMSEHRRKQDYALWLAILRTGICSHPLDIELAYYRQTPNSATSKKYSLVFKHFLFLRTTQEMGVLRALYYTGFWATNGLIRYYIK